MDPNTPGTHLLAQYLRYILTFQLFLGGQARLTSALTPTLHHRAMAKAEGAQKFLAFLIPIRDPKQHTRFIGLLMCFAGALIGGSGFASERMRLGLRLRLAGALLSGSLSLAGVYSQVRMGMRWWLPGVNTLVAGVIVWDGMVDGARS